MLAYDGLSQNLKDFKDQNLKYLRGSLHLLLHHFLPKIRKDIWGDEEHSVDVADGSVCKELSDVFCHQGQS